VVLCIRRFSGRKKVRAYVVNYAQETVLSPEGRGFCGVRENRKGKLFSLVYGKPCSIAVDPIEKKPFYHFAPGTRTLSIATVGCNFRCSFCQNFEISQTNTITKETISPKELIAMNKTRAFMTYTEPTVFYEYFYETAKLCRKKFCHAWSATVIRTLNR